MRVVTGHQPVYLPWLGLFHKIALADVFVFMDDVQYLTQDWNNRNRVQGNGAPFWLTVPVSLKRSQSKILKDIRIVSQGFGKNSHWQAEHWLGLKSAYAKAPHWERYAQDYEALYLERPWEFLSELNEAILRLMLRQLDIQVEIIKASEYGFQGVKSNLVLDHCTKLGADICVTGTHGRDYIDVQSFLDQGISLHFQDYAHPAYAQRTREFTPCLSVLDLLFHHGPESRDILLSGNITRDELEQAAHEGPVLIPSPGDRS